eukprot:CAMPEP_0119039916 /NCGR_PEP_ID=MMETSP1177-20130426/9674_1 /TAXON_ID=2985 /ORGANISM="Ochromonas sp, Strain CCMP1899" /LENGTH=424 /DNA_ID=CAMNT_0007004421 /DNA_START=243 /DNA_END=1514 /DNA_ORIENTATION=-
MHDFPESVDTLMADSPRVEDDVDEDGNEDDFDEDGNQKRSNNDIANQQSTESEQNEDTYYLDEADFDSLCNNDNIQQEELGIHQEEDIAQGVASSFRDIPFESEEMLKFLSYNDKESQPTATIEDLTYKSNNIFPDWITSNIEWKGAKKAQGGSVGDILSRPSGQRSHEQNFAVISFIMSSWETANLLGYKRTSLLFKDVKQVSHEKGDQIVVAGEASMFLYIVVTGQVSLQAKAKSKLVFTAPNSPRTPNDENMDGLMSSSLIYDALNTVTQDEHEHNDGIKLDSDSDDSSINTPIVTVDPAIPDPPPITPDRKKKKYLNDKSEKKKKESLTSDHRYPEANPRRVSQAMKDKTQKQVGPGMCFCEKVLSKGIIVSPYTATSESKVELLALHKTDFDIFMKEIRSSERREIFMVLRDNFLFENW